MESREAARFIEYEKGKKYAKRNADIADTHESFQDAGYILTENDLIVDIDNLEKEIIKKIISMFNIKTQIVWTDRGAHFYFKKPQGFKGSTKVCPLGFEVEYKHSKNTPNGVTIKRNGKMREMENAGIREDLPDIFYCNRRLEPLLGMDDNEGRNKKLFAHRMKIQGLNQWKSILRFINNNIFATPLPEEEFNTVSRDGVKVEAKSNNEPEIAEHLIQQYKIINYLDNAYWYDGNEYISGDDKLRRLIIQAVGQQKKRYIEEVLWQIKHRASLIDANKTFVIKLQNGILRNGKFLKIDYKEFTPYSIDIPYDPEAEPVEIVEEYLNHLTNNDEDYKKRLLEALAHPLIVDKDFKRMLAKFFIFVGGGGNGKGTLLRIINEILGLKNVSSLSIKQMQDERYLVTMQGKLANLGDDIEDDYIDKKEMKLLKNVSTCDRIQIRRLHEQSFDAELTCSLIFTSNHILKSKGEKGDAYKRRVDWMPMFAKPTKKDANFIQKLTTKEAKQYWMKLIVEAYKRLYENKGFTESAVVSNFNEEYHRINNNILDFFEDKSKKDFIGLGKIQAYKNYKQWCEDNEEYVQGKEKFHEQLCDFYGLEYAKIHIKDGKNETTTTVYIEKGGKKSLTHDEWYHLYNKKIKI